MSSFKTCLKQIKLLASPHILGEKEVLVADLTFRGTKAPKLLTFPHQNRRNTKTFVWALEYSSNSFGAIFDFNEKLYNFFVLIVTREFHHVARGVQPWGSMALGLAPADNSMFAISRLEFVWQYPTAIAAVDRSRQCFFFQDPINNFVSSSWLL